MRGEPGNEASYTPVPELGVASKTMCVLPSSNLWKYIPMSKE